MLMWLIILVLVIAVSVSAVVYLIKKFRRFSFLDNLKDKHPKLSWAAAAAPVVLINLLASIFMNVWAAVIMDDVKERGDEYMTRIGDLWKEHYSRLRILDKSVSDEERQLATAAKRSARRGESW